MQDTLTPTDQRAVNAAMAVFWHRVEADERRAAFLRALTDCTKEKFHAAHTR